MQRLALGLLIGTLAIAVSACSGLIDELPTTPTPQPITETFNGTLTVNGGRTHQFFTAATGTITATLTSLGENAPETLTVGFSMGTMTGASCNIVIANDSARVTSVVTGTVSTLSGSLCMRVYDVGNLTEPIDYTFTVSHP